jgi:protein gp37
MEAAWALNLRDQCSAAKIPFFFKQWGEFDAAGQRVGKKAAGRELDGCLHSEFPR